MSVRIRNELLPLNIFVILLIVVIIFLPSNILRIIMGVPFLLFIPGYTLVAAIFPGRSGLGNGERVLLSLGLSAIVVLLIGLALNYTPWGIRLYPVLISLSVLILATSAVAWYRRRRLPEAERFTVSLNLNFASWRGRSAVDKALMVVLIASIVTVAGTLGYVIAGPKAGDSLSEFYILGLEGETGNYPGEVIVGTEAKVVMGIINREHEDMSYRVEITVDGIRNNEISPVRLGHEDKWEQETSFTLTKAGEKQKVEFVLYKEGEPEGQLHLWVDAVSR